MPPAPKEEPYEETCQSQNDQSHNEKYSCNFAGVGEETSVSALLRLSSLGWRSCWGDCQCFDLARDRRYGNDWGW